MRKNINNIKKFLINNSALIIILMLLVVPAVSSAYNIGDPIVPCGTTTTAPCDFGGFMLLVNNIKDFVIFELAMPIAAIMFFYAGFLMITAGGEAATARTKAKNIFTNAVIGLVVAAACWLIVSAILSILGYDGAWIGFPLI
jgi:hypothetical protein